MASSRRLEKVPELYEGKSRIYPLPLDRRVAMKEAGAFRVAGRVVSMSSKFDLAGPIRSTNNIDGATMKDHPCPGARSKISIVKI